MIGEDKQFRVIGETRDIIRYADGRVEDTGWGRNIIVKNFDILIATLLKGDTAYKGIQYWAIGSGEETWETTGNPTPNPLVTDTGCVNEFARKKIPLTNIHYVNEEGLVTETPTHRIQISLTFEEAEAVGKWREFSIFGGNATATKNTGLALNHRTHGLIDKTNTMVVERVIRFTFL